MVGGTLRVATMSPIWRFIPNRIAKEIKKYVHEDVDDEFLERAISIARLGKRKTEQKPIEWVNWGESYQILETILNVLSGFGGAFLHALELKEFYFRELHIRIGSAKVTRAWIKNALSIGLIKRDSDPHGVVRYVVDPKGLRRIRDIIVRALEDLI